MRVIVAILLTFASLSAITNKQIKTAHEVYNEAKKWTTYPTTITQIAFVESSFGYYLIGDDGNSLGVTQVQVATAKWLANKDDRLKYLLSFSDKKVASLLLEDMKLNVKVTSILFEYHRIRYGYESAKSRHNGGAYNVRYLNKMANCKKFVVKILRRKIR